MLKKSGRNHMYIKNIAANCKYQIKQKPEIWKLK